VQHHAADQLDIEMALAERALAGFAHGGECRHEDVVERLSLGDLLLEHVGARAQRLVGELLQLLLQRVDFLHARPIGADAPVVGGTEQLAGHTADHRVILPNGALRHRLPCPRGFPRSAQIRPRENAALLGLLQDDMGRLDIGRDIGGGRFLVNARRLFTRSLRRCRESAIAKRR
jgi:hypothetical protein